MFKRITVNYVWWVWVFLIIVVMLGWNFGVNEEQQYLYLSKAFLAGRVDLGAIPGSVIDLITFNGKYYWHLGPLPALLMVPLVAVWGEIKLGYIQPFLTGGIILWAYDMARRYAKNTKFSAFTLALGLVFGTFLLQEALTAKSWHVAQLWNILFVGLYIRQVLKRGSYWMVGLWLAMATMTRYNAITGIVYAVGMLISDREWSLKQKIDSFIKMSVVVTLGICVLMGYNYLRFGSVWESGYTNINSPYIGKEIKEDIDKNGMFQLKFFKSNFYDYFLRLPVKTYDQFGQWTAPYFTPFDPGGVSFWLTSPWLFYVFKANFRKKEVLVAGITTLIFLTELLLFFSNGGREVGPRYFTDFLPYIFVMVITAFKGKEVRGVLKLLMVFGGVVTWYLYETMGGI